MQTRQVLQGAVADGTAALTSVAAGFETALLECAAPDSHAGGLPPDLLPAAERPAVSLKEAAGAVFLRLHLIISLSHISSH